MVGLILNAPVREGSRRLSDPVLLDSSETAFRVFESSDGALTIEAVDGPLVRARFAFEAVDGGDRVEVEGTVTADPDAAVDLPVVARP